MPAPCAIPLTAPRELCRLVLGHHHAVATRKLRVGPDRAIGFADIVGDRYLAGETKSGHRLDELVHEQAGPRPRPFGQNTGAPAVLRRK